MGQVRAEFSSCFRSTDAIVGPLQGCQYSPRCPARNRGCARRVSPRSGGAHGPYHALGERMGTDNLRIAGILGPANLAMLCCRRSRWRWCARDRSGCFPGEPGHRAARRSAADIEILDTSGTVCCPSAINGSSPLADIGRPVATAEELRNFVVDGLFGRTFLPLNESIHRSPASRSKSLSGQVPTRRTSSSSNSRASRPRSAPPPGKRTAPPSSSGASGASRPAQARCKAHANDHLARPERRRADHPHPPLILLLIYQVPTGRMCGACPSHPSATPSVRKGDGR